MRTTSLTLVLFAKLLCLPLASAEEWPAWFSDSNNKKMDVRLPESLSYGRSGRPPLTAVLPGTGIKVSWSAPAGCWSPRDYLGNPKKNLVAFRKIEVASSPDCVKEADLESCSIAGKGKLDGIEVDFQVTMAAVGKTCGHQVQVTGNANDMKKNGALLAELRAGFAPLGSRAAKARIAVDDEDNHDELEAPAERVTHFDPKLVPDLKRKVPGACRGVSVNDMGVDRLTWTYQGDRMLSYRNDGKSGAGDPLFDQEDHAYDDKGRRVRTTFTSTNIETRVRDFTYDAQGRLIRERETAGDGELSRSEYTYDAAGRKLKTTQSYDGGEPSVTTFEYDASGRKVKETRTGPGEKPDVRAFEYDAKGRPTKEGTTTVTWSEDGRTRHRKTPPSPGSGSAIGSSSMEVVDAYGNVLREKGSDFAGSYDRTFDYSCWAK